MAQCANDHCDATVKDDRRSRIRAYDDGWFFSRQEAFCPAHVPSWVTGWRAKKAEKTKYERMEVCLDDDDDE